MKVREIHHVIHLLQLSILANILQGKAHVLVVLELDNGRLEADGGLSTITHNVLLGLVLRDGHLGSVLVLLDETSWDPCELIGSNVHIVGGSSTSI